MLQRPCELQSGMMSNVRIVQCKCNIQYTRIQIISNLIVIKPEIIKTHEKQQKQKFPRSHIIIYRQNK